MLVADLKVSGHFQANDGGVVKPTHITYKDYADKKIDLLAQIKVSKSSNTLTGTISLYDINASKHIYTKNYTEDELK